MAAHFRGRLAVTPTLGPWPPNEEYASHPLKTTAPSIHDAPKRRARLERIAADIDRQLEPFGGLKGRKALDFGSGRGDLAIALADHAGCSSVVGVDIRAYPEWELLTHPRVEFLHADLSDEHVARGLQDEFDVIVSNSVFEHVVHPFAALQGLSRTLRPGGLMWLSANLYRGPLASHRYREVFFPWPHLLFTDHVFSQFYEWHSSTQRSASWVNKLTHLHYREYFAELGLEVLAEHFSTTPIDEAFYARFESVLGRYPRSDLEKDFIKVILRRPARHASVRMLDRASTAFAGRFGG